MVRARSPLFNGLDPAGFNDLCQQCHYGRKSKSHNGPLTGRAWYLKGTVMEHQTGNLKNTVGIKIYKDAGKNIAAICLASSWGFLVWGPHLM